MTVSTGDILRVALSYSGPASSIPQSVFWFQAAGGSSPNDRVMDDFESWAETDWGTDWADFASNQYNLDLVEVTKMNTDGTVSEVIGARSLDVPGTATSDPSAAFSAGYALARTDVPKTKGSKYVPGVPESGVTSNLITGDTLADLVLLLAVLLAVYNGSESGLQFLPGVLSRVLEDFVEFNDTGYVTDVPAAQRRRKPNVGS